MFCSRCCCVVGVFVMCCLNDFPSVFIDFIIACLLCLLCLFVCLLVSRRKIRVKKNLRAESQNDQLYTRSLGMHRKAVMLRPKDKQLKDKAESMALHKICQRPVPLYVEAMLAESALAMASTPPRCSEEPLCLRNAVFLKVRQGTMFACLLFSRWSYVRSLECERAACTSRFQATRCGRA